MAPLTWKVVPTANTLAAVDPALRADLNPNFPGGAPWAGSNGVQATLNAWGTLVPSQDDGRVWMANGGGHSDYAGNESYAIDFMAEAPAYSLLHPPSGAIGYSPGIAYSGGEATGLYPDGRLRAMHGYSQGIHIPGGDIFIAMVSAPFYDPVATAQKSWWIDADTGVHSLASDYTALTEVQGNGEGGSAYDESRNVVWHLRNGSGLGVLMMKTDLATGVTTSHGARNTYVGDYCSFVRIPELDLVLNLNGAGSGGFFIWNPATETWKLNPTVTGSYPTGMRSVAASGAKWIPSLGKVVMWNNSSNGAVFSTLTPPASDPINGTWTRGTLSPDASNTVVPNVFPVAYIFGKCGYLPAMKGFYLKPTWASPTWFFATE